MSNEMALEIARKEETDRQWNEFHSANELAKVENSTVSQKQKSYIFALARSVGLRVDVSKVTDKQKAHQII